MVVEREKLGKRGREGIKNNKYSTLIILMQLTGFEPVTFRLLNERSTPELKLPTIKRC